MIAPTLIIVTGPTASGKTDLAISLAKKMGTEVISADSRQFYKDMQIGTARPLLAELRGVKHHFLGHLELNEKMSAGHFAKEAWAVCQSLFERAKPAIAVGGSGLYLDALSNGLDDLPQADEALREELDRLDHDQRVEQLNKLDPISAKELDLKNPHRVIRALEVCLTTGEPFSSFKSGSRKRDGLQLVKLAIQHGREHLYERINTRVDRMMDAGLLEEVRGLQEHREMNALKTVGYKELFAHFDGKLTLHEAVAKIKQHTRNYAKRQLTWLRKDDSLHWLQADSLDLFVEEFEPTTFIQS